MCLLTSALVACSFQQTPRRAFTPFPTVNRRISPTVGSKSTETQATSRLQTAGAATSAAQETAAAQLAAEITLTPTMPLSATETINPLVCLPEEAVDGNSGEIGLVGWIQDGQTIVVDFQGERRSVRLLGLDAPPIAERMLRTLLENQVVRIFRDPNSEFETASDGTPFGYVLTADGSFINFEMLRLGEARLDEKERGYACQQVLQSAEMVAKAAVIGLWGVQAANPLPTQTAAPTLPPATLPAATSVALAPTPAATLISGTPATPSTPATPTVTLPPGVTPTITLTPTTQSPQTTTAPNASVTPATATPTTGSGPGPGPAFTPTATPSGEGFSDVDVHIVNIYWSGNPAKNQSDEYIELQNQGSEPFDLGDWSVYAEDIGIDAYFPPGFTLAPGAFCRVYTNEIHPDSCGGATKVSFESTEELWPDDVTACGTLWDADENLLADYCY